MSIDYVRTIVRQTIPGDRLTPIERWLLTRVFEPTETDDGLSFDAEWSLNDILEEEVFPDDELTTALAASREICPELCAEVERVINESKGIYLGAINYERIFQSILRRHPDVLPCVSIEVLVQAPDCNSRWGIFHETLKMITAQSIQSINSDGNGRSELITQSEYIGCIARHPLS